jgi:hypothetical protein
MASSTPIDPTAPAAPDRGTAFRQLLQAGVAFDPLYPTERFGPLTDHLPMALTALHALGAGSAQLQVFRDTYARKLVPMRTAGDADAADRLGVPAAYPALLARFEAELAADGRAAVLARWIPRLIDALAVHALHPLIRTAAALEHDVDRELAAALAYWCSAHMQVPAPRIARRDLPAETAAATLFAAVRGHVDGGATPLQAAGFGSRLLELAARPGFVDFSGWRPAQLELAHMAREAARVYLGTGDFFALHMVTGSHALRCVLPWVADVEGALDRWWQALAATYVVIGAPDYQGWQDLREPARVPDGEAMVRTSMDALAADDPEHVVKLLWSAREEHAAHGFDEHARIAARVCATGRA